MVRIAVVFYGGQYNHLIWRRLREQGAEAVLVRPSTPPEDIEKEFDGVVISGGPYTLPKDLDKLGETPRYPKEISKPILGICLGHQLIALVMGGEITRAAKPEYGEVEVIVDDEDDILRGLAPRFDAWASHTMEVSRLPEGFKRIAHTEATEIEAMKHEKKPIYGVQFHPEVQHTPKGYIVFRNFMEICKR